MLPMQNAGRNVTLKETAQTYREHLSNCLLRKRKESEKRARKQGRGGEKRERRQAGPFRGELDPLVLSRPSHTPERGRGKKWVTLLVLQLGK